MRPQGKYQVLLVAVAAGLLFILFLGAVHLFDWDEINFAECAREMLLTGNFLNLQMNFQPFWEKPPFFIWLQALSMHCFGVSDFAARLPNAVCGVLTTMVLFEMGRKYRDWKFGLFWCLSFAGSTLPHFYFKSGIIDPWFNFFIFLSFCLFIRHMATRALKLLVLSGIFAGLALLTKGPAALVILGISVFVVLALRKFKPMPSLSGIGLYLLAVLIFGGIWFLMLVASGKTAIIENFISYQVHLFGAEDAGHGGPFYYHLLVLFFGCFPSSVLALPAFGRQEENGENGNFRTSMIVLFLVVLLLFSVVQTKIVHYSSLCYFPLSYLSAHTLWRLSMGKARLHKKYLVLLFVSVLPLVAGLIALPFINDYKHWLVGQLDEFTAGNLMADVQWTRFEALTGLMPVVFLMLFAFLVNKRPSRAAILLLAGNALITETVLLVYVPRIECYAQGEVIGFYESLQGEDCYAESLNYLSYAPYYYTRKKPLVNSLFYSRDQLLKGPIDKDAYFVSKVTLEQENAADRKNLRELYRKNGWVFYKREAVALP